MGMLEPTSGEYFGFKMKIWVPILGIFLYKRPKTRENVPTSSRHISVTVDIWEESEPILKMR